MLFCLDMLLKTVLTWRLALSALKARFCEHTFSAESAHFLVA